MSKGYLYILECADGSYYTGSTNNLELRLAQHQAGKGANHTQKHLPVKLVYFEEYERIDQAFYREKQVQGWSRKKKEALINSMPEKLHELAQCMNETHCKNYSAEVGDFDYAQSPDNDYAQSPSKDYAQSPAPTRCLSGVEGSNTEGHEISGLKAYE